MVNSIGDALAGGNGNVIDENFNQRVDAFIDGLEGRGRVSFNMGMQNNGRETLPPEQLAAELASYNELIRFNSLTPAEQFKELSEKYFSQNPSMRERYNLLISKLPEMAKVTNFDTMKVILENMSVTPNGDVTVMSEDSARAFLKAEQETKMVYEMTFVTFRTQPAFMFYGGLGNYTGDEFAQLSTVFAATIDTSTGDIKFTDHKGAQVISGAELMRMPIQGHEVYAVVKDGAITHLLNKTETGFEISAQVSILGSSKVSELSKTKPEWYQNAEESSATPNSRGFFHFVTNNDIANAANIKGFNGKIIISHMDNLHFPMGYSDVQKIQFAALISKRPDYRTNLGADDLKQAVNNVKILNDGTVYIPEMAPNSFNGLAVPTQGTRIERNGSVFSINGQDCFLNQSGIVVSEINGTEGKRLLVTYHGQVLGEIVTTAALGLVRNSRNNQFQIIEGYDMDYGRSHNWDQQMVFQPNKGTIQFTVSNSTWQTNLELWANLAIYARQLPASVRQVYIDEGNGKVTMYNLPPAPPADYNAYEALIFAILVGKYDEDWANIDPRSLKAMINLLILNEKDGTLDFRFVNQGVLQSRPVVPANGTLLDRRGDQYTMMVEEYTGGGDNSYLAMVPTPVLQGAVIDANGVVKIKNLEVGRIEETTETVWQYNEWDAYVQVTIPKWRFVANDVGIYLNAINTNTTLASLDGSSGRINVGGDDNPIDPKHIYFDPLFGLFTPYGNIQRDTDWTDVLFDQILPVIIIGAVSYMTAGAASAAFAASEGVIAAVGVAGAAAGAAVVNAAVMSAITTLFTDGDFNDFTDGILKNLVLKQVAGLGDGLSTTFEGIGLNPELAKFASRFVVGSALSAAQGQDGSDIWIGGLASAAQGAARDGVFSDSLRSILPDDISNRAFDAIYDGFSSFIIKGITSGDLAAAGISGGIASFGTYFRPQNTIQLDTPRLGDGTGGISLTPTQPPQSIYSFNTISDKIKFGIGDANYSPDTGVLSTALDDLHNVWLALPTDAQDLIGDFLKNLATGENGAIALEHALSNWISGEVGEYIGGESGKIAEQTLHAGLNSIIAGGNGNDAAIAAVRAFGEGMNDLVKKVYGSGGGDAFGNYFFGNPSQNSGNAITQTPANSNNGPSNPAADRSLLNQTEMTINPDYYRSVSGRSYVVQYGDSLETISGGRGAAFAGAILAANNMTQPEFLIGHTIFIPDDENAYGDMSARGQSAIESGAIYNQARTDIFNGARGTLVRDDEVAFSDDESYSSGRYVTDLVVKAYADAQDFVSQMPVREIFDKNDPHQYLIFISEDGTENSPDTKYKTNPYTLSELVKQSDNKNIEVIYTTGVASEWNPLRINAALGLGVPYQIDETISAVTKKVNDIRQNDPNANFVFVTTGFSRGSGVALAVQNELVKNGIPDTSSAYTVLEGEGSSLKTYYGKSAIEPGAINIGASVLYDAVTTGVGNLYDMSVPSNVQQTLHLTSQNEVRWAFPLTLALGPNGAVSNSITQLTLPGVHSDLGGTYDQRGIAAANLLLGYTYLQRAGVPLAELPQNMRPNPSEFIIHDSRWLRDGPIEPIINQPTQPRVVANP